MTREEAQRLTQHLVSAQRELAAALKYAEGITNTSEAESLRKTLMSAIADIAAYALAPILEIHPEFQPVYSEDDE